MWFQEYVHRVENKQFISKSSMSDSIYPPANYNKYFCQLFFLHDDIWNVNCRCYELFTNYFQWTVPKPRGKKNDVQFLQWSEGSSEHRAASVCFCFISISPASHLQIKEKIFFYIYWCIFVHLLVIIITFNILFWASSNINIASIRKRCHYVTVSQFLLI